MVETQETFTEREEIEMLLPWFVSGRLDAQDQAKVERYLAAHPEMALQLDLIRDEQGETIVANEALGGAPAGALDRLRDAIAAEPNRVSIASVRQSIWKEIAKLFTAPTPRAVQWAGAAAAIVLVAQAVLIGGLLSGGADGAKQSQPQIAERSGGSAQDAAPQGSRSVGRRFRVASGAAAAGTRVQVRFADDVTASALATFLRAERMEIVSGPKPGGYFELQISKQKLAGPGLDAVVAKLQANKSLIKEVLQ